jgi:hypothetical protein
MLGGIVVNMTSLRYMLVCLGLLAWANCLAGDLASMARSYASDIRALGFGLFETGYSEFDAVKSRKLFDTRFIPNAVIAFPDDEGNSHTIVILVTYRHGGEIENNQDATKACEGMINWVRFQLGVKDKGGLISYASEYKSSTLYRSIPPKDPKLNPESYATALDSATVIRGMVIKMPGSPGNAADGNAHCLEPLIP